MNEDGSDPLGTTPVQLPKTQFNPLWYNLPTRLADSVPKCGPSARDVRRYLDDVEEVGNNHSMTGGVMIGMAFYYADRERRLLWKTVGSSNGDDWSMFKEDVSKLYPDAFDDEGALRRFCSAQPIFRNADDVRTYFTSFLCIVDDILASGVSLSDRQKHYYFKEGLHYNFRLALTRRLVVLGHSGAVDTSRLSVEFLFKESMFLFLEQQKKGLL